MNFKFYWEIEIGFLDLTGGIVLKKRMLFSSLALAAFLVGCGDSSAPAEKGTDTTKTESSTGAETSAEKVELNLVTIGTGGASGPYNILGTTLAGMYSTDFGVNSRTQTTGASVENINLLEQGKIEMAFVMSDALSQALAGEVSFSSTCQKCIANCEFCILTLFRSLQRKVQALKRSKI